MIFSYWQFLYFNFFAEKYNCIRIMKMFWYREAVTVFLHSQNENGLIS
jgi:hypothetical protein